MKKITTIAILLLFVLHSNAQVIVPVEKQYDYKIAGKGIPAGTYLKDVNNLFDAYVGIWKGSIDLKNYTFFISKRTETSYGSSTDELFMHYLITDLQGIAIEDSRAPGGSGEIWGRFFQPDLLYYHLQYAAENNMCGRIGQVSIRKINATTMTLDLSPRPEGGPYDDCPGGKLQEQILPVTPVTLTKQPDNASVMTTVVLKNWYIDDDNDGRYWMIATQADAPFVGNWKEGVSLYGVKDCDDENPNKWADCPPSRNWFQDEDNDGYYSKTVYKGDKPLVGNWVITNQGIDCDDTNNTITKNCYKSWYKDDDGDGWGGLYTSGITKPSGGTYIETVLGIDCCDTDASITSNCTPFLWYEDMDGDGYHTAYQSSVCHPETGSADALLWKLTTKGVDCNDEDNTITTACYLNWYQDNDGDKWGIFYVNQIEKPAGPYIHNPLGVDCDDTNPALTTNCPVMWYSDYDGDGYHYEEQLSVTNPDGLSPTIWKLTTKGLDCNDDIYSIDNKKCN